MSDAHPDLHPFSLTVEPIPGNEGQWRWAIRKHGKLYERSDRSYPSEAKAAQAALELIERHLKARG